MTTLDLVLFLPLIGFLVLMMVPKSNPGASRMGALVISLAVFVASLLLLAPYWYATPTGYTFTTNVSWINYPPIRYHVGIDGLSLWLVLLTTLLTPIALLVSWKSVDHRVKEFFAFMLLLEFGMIGTFVALDLFLFFTFWEVSLVPMYFLIGIWGHERRIYAAVKFFLYTMAGSALMLAAIIYLYNKSGTFDYTSILAMLQSGGLALDSKTSMLLFLAFFIAFAIKVPIFPLHTWLPDAHVEAPTAGSVMLASVMLKMGTYGLLRYCLLLFPAAAHTCAPWIAGLAIVGILYGALVALVQPNMKKLVAYSSVSHLGFVVLGIFSSPRPDSTERCTRCSITASPPARCSSWSAISMSGAIRWKSPPMAVSPRPPPIFRPSSWSPRWPLSACPRSTTSSASTWCFRAPRKPTSLGRFSRRWARFSLPATCCGCISGCSTERPPIR